MTDDIKKAQELLDKGKVWVKDVETVRYFIKKGEKTPQETYDILTEIIAREGALCVPFRELPKVKEVLRKTSNVKANKS